MRDRERFGAWLYGIALNKAKRRIRDDGRRRKRHDALKSSVSEPAVPDELAARKEIRSEVLAALQRLPEANRETATLYYIDGYSTADISRFTNRPVGTTKRRLHDARKKLRKELAAMVEDELKKARPGKEFTKRVLRRIRRVRVWVTGKHGNVLFLTDSRSQSFWISVDPFVAQSLQPWLSGSGTEQDLDMHTAVTRVLRAFGFEISQFAFTYSRVVSFGVLRIAAGKQVVDIDCSAEDGINLAARAGAPMLVAKEVFGARSIKRKDGKPMTPQSAWRQAKRQMEEHFKNVETVRFKDMSEVVRTLERDPEAPEARFALTEAIEGFKWTPSRIKNRIKAMSMLRSWVKRCKGTEREGLALGLLGSVHVWPLMDFGKAIPHLETASQLRPQDARIAFELATAYAMTGKADEALSILEGERSRGTGVPIPTACGNFVCLWDDPRFRHAVGEPDPRCAKVLQVPQLRIVATVGDPPGRKRAALPPDFKTPDISPPHVREIGELSARGPLLVVTQVSMVASHPRSGSRGSRRRAKVRWHLVLDVAGNRGATVKLGEQDAHLVGMIQRQSFVRQPEAPYVACSILKGLQITLQAAVLVRRSRSGVEGALIVAKDRKQDIVAITGGGAVAMALAGECPLLIAEELAEKLYVRGKTGRPLSARSARRRPLSA